MLSRYTAESMTIHLLLISVRHHQLMRYRLKIDWAIGNVARGNVGQGVTNLRSAHGDLDVAGNCSDAAAERGATSDTLGLDCSNACKRSRGISTK